MPLPELKGTLTDIGTEELNHLEMIGAIVYQLTKDLTEDEIKEQGFGDYFVDHTTGIFPQAAAGFPYTAASMQVKGDPITDLHESMAAEQKARTTYDNILRFCDDYDVKDPIRFLRAREVVHYQRFGENLRLLTDKLNEKNFYAFNPSFDKKCFKNELKKKKICTSPSIYGLVHFNKLTNSTILQNLSAAFLLVHEFLSNK